MRAHGQAAGWYVISMRPRGGHAGVRRAAAARGARVIALSPWTLRPRDDAQARAALAQAFAAPRIVFTSPAAVHAACALLPLAAVAEGAALFAVGAGTASALRRGGADRVQAPARMDSEGVLSLPGLRQVRGGDVGLVTAPGGRGVIDAALRSRGARVVRADVYDRAPVPLRRDAVSALEALDAPAVVLLSSGEALARVLEALPPAARDALRACPVVAASDRLQALAGEAGFGRVARADGPRPAQLVRAADALVGPARRPPPQADRFR